MNYWKVILATLVIFGAGVVTGGLVVRYVTPTSVAPRRTAIRPPQPPSPAFSRLEFLRRAQRELDLTPEQHQQMDALLKDSQERTRKLLQPVEGDLRQELQRTREAFRALLTPAQQARFDELVRKPQRPRESREREARDRARSETNSGTHSPAPAPGSQP